VVVGGLAVNAHGVIRSTKVLDICPAPDRPNLARLAGLLRELDVRHEGAGDFGPQELPFDPTRDEDLAEGGNFRLVTPHGLLDLMQWIPGIDAAQAYATLAGDAETATAFGVHVKVCSLEHLRLMKRTAGRPQDLVDLEDLAAAHPEGEAGG